MKISINTMVLNKCKDDKERIKLLKDAGFDAYDYSMCDRDFRVDGLADDYVEKAKELRRCADEIGIECNQSHAPFPTFLIGNEEYNKEVFPYIVRAIEVTSILGGSMCVVHPCNDASPERNAEFYNSLLPYAKKFNVKIGLENMWNWSNGHASDAACSNPQNFNTHLKLLDNEWFVANLDIGHSEMFGLNTTAVEMIRELKDNLYGLHIHDNNKERDLHAVPYSVYIDFDAMCEGLKECEYKGDVTLEVDLHNTPSEMYPTVTKYMADVAKRLKRHIEN